MDDKRKTKAQLIGELEELRRRVAQMENAGEPQTNHQPPISKIIETAQEAIWMVDAQANTTYVNQHLAEMLGYTTEELVGRSVFDFVDKADRPWFPPHLYSTARESSSGDSPCSST